jgi:hypothetical protein
MHGFGVIARGSCRRSWNRSELWRAIPGARKLNLGKPFRAVEQARRGEAEHVYIVGVQMRWKFGSNSDFIIYKI